MRITPNLLATLLALAIAPGAHAGEHVVTQKNKSFSVTRLAVKTGDTVRFTNDDPFNHNIFSLSEAKSFDLGSYGHGLSKTVVLDKPGMVEVECAVHPDMKLMVEVRK